MKFLNVVLAPRRLWFIQLLSLIRLWRCKGLLTLNLPHSRWLLLCLWCSVWFFWVAQTILSEGVKVWDIFDVLRLIGRVDHVLFPNKLKLIVRGWQLAWLFSYLYVFSLYCWLWGHLKLQILHRGSLLSIMHFILLLMDCCFFGRCTRYVGEAPAKRFGRITVCIMIRLLLSHCAQY